ncbi:MAG TPA: hypothetical protein VL100_08635, partial [Croceibacterium sp.]|nr:hypothetical protein [Croceibacterium sp.]
SGHLQTSDQYEAYADHPQAFLDMLREAPPLSDPVLHASQEAFLTALEVTLPPLPTRAEAIQWLPEHAAWFLDLQRKGTAAYTEKMARLLELSQHPERTERFIGKSATTSGDFTNVGGIDTELCHLRGFYPEFSIRS